MDKIRKPIRLLYICETIDYGVGQNVKDLIILALKAGHSVTLIWSETRTGLQYKQWIMSIVDRKFESHVVPMSREPSLKDIDLIWSVLSIIRRAPEKFDLVHGFSSKGGAIARIVGTLLNFPQFYSPHAYILSDPTLSSVKRKFYFLIEKILNIGAYVICTSKEEISITQRIGARGMKFIPNGIDLSDAVINERKREGSVKISFVGRFCDQKNPLLFVKIAQELSGLPVEFHMFGDGELMDTVQAAIPEMLRPRIHLHGRVQPQTIWSNTNLMLCTSRYEGFPYTFIQSIARGIPLLSTNVGGVDSVIDDGINGLIYEEGSLEEVIDFVGKFTQNEQFSRGVIDACIKKSRHFSREKMHQELMQFYNEVVGA